MKDEAPPHPSDDFSRIAANTTSARRLTTQYDAIANEYSRWDLELVCSVAIARVRLLEEMLDERVSPVRRDERRVRALLKPHTGNVVPLRPRPRDDAA